MEKYLNDIIYSLLDDDSFVQWVLCPTLELNMFWEDEFSKSNELRESAYILKNIIKKFKIEEPALSADDKQVIWKNIQQGISRDKKRKTLWRRYMQVASVAVIAVLLSGGYLYVVNNSKQIEIDYASMLNDSIGMPSSNNISLILSNNKVVDIQRDSTNVIYDEEGRVNVDSEQIEDTETGKASLNQLIVPYGKMTSLTLSDGTKIWVNSGTKLIYPSVFEKNKREIFLVGEIYLDVVKNEKSPFIIKTNHMDVNVLGTQLNISAYADESLHSVVLVSGAVNVKSKELKGTYDIYPDQMFTYGVDSDKADVRKVDVNNYISWIYGYLLLQSESLDRVLQKLERHYNISFTYNTSDFKNIYVSGKLDLRGSPESALNYISITTPITYTINDDTIKIELAPKK
ncbi:hypothetical protein GGR21_000044 [Dysgonomonas hofstadii]|uniref:FecR family protein n=1 Tax=Dysgonomonas hofstadii TaxID=637886 RepID=A0A840CHM4_9BACT|nr:FecR family protein [Dysgonomonas hofstadii]MBB4034159.1 hypothetical protein [Dysgonomonas hofstadii]